MQRVVGNAGGARRAAEEGFRSPDHFVRACDLLVGPVFEARLLID